MLDTSAVVITGGTVVDDLGTRRADVRVRDGVVVDVAENLERSGDEASLDASGCVVAPGLVDLHVHLREPGDEEAETIETGTRAAARGGFTAVVAMPNTRPALDDAAVVSSVLATGKAAGLCEVVSSGCITVGRAGQQIGTDGGALRARRPHLHRRRFLRRQRGGDAARARVRRVAARRGGRATRGGREPRRRRTHARGRVVEPARYPRSSGGGGDGDRRPRHRALPRSPARRCTSSTARRPGRWSSYARPRRVACR